MFKLLEDLENLKNKKTEHRFQCDQCNNMNENVNTNCCESYNQFMIEETILDYLIDNYKIDID